MSHLARHSGASFVGVNISDYQIERAKLHARDVKALCRFIHGDYTQRPERRRYPAAFQPRNRGLGRAQAPGQFRLCQLRPPRDLPAQACAATSR